MRRALVPQGGHHIGTARMGVDASAGVVDTNCEVWGSRGLFVAGAAVLPTSGFANPTLTALALAFRLAEYLVRRRTARLEGGEKELVMDNRRGLYRDNVPVLVPRDGNARPSTPSCRRSTARRSAPALAGVIRSENHWVGDGAERSQPSPGKPRSPFIPCLRLESRPVENRRLVQLRLGVRDKHLQRSGFARLASLFSTLQNCYLFTNLTDCSEQQLRRLRRQLRRQGRTMSRFISPPRH